MKEATQREYKRRVCLAMDEIHRRVDESFSLEEIARYAAFSKFHFHRIFRDFVGETVFAFQRRLRLERAATWLVYRPQDDVTTIAFNSGFSSSQNFAKAFKSRYSLSPVAYRKKYAADGFLAFSKNSNPGNALWDARQYLRSDSERLAKFGEKGGAMIEHVVMRTLPARRVAYTRHIGSYGDFLGIESAFGALLGWAEEQPGFASDELFGLLWDDPTLTPPAHCRFDVCIGLSDSCVPSDMSVQELPGGLYAVVRGMMSEVESSDLWDRLFVEWLPQSGYIPSDGPCLEIYHAGPEEHPQGLWDISICLPVEVMS